MTKLTELLKSRKFRALIVTLAVDAWGFFTGVVDANVAMASASALVSVWMNAQSNVDAAKVAAPTE